MNLTRDIPIPARLFDSVPTFEALTYMGANRDESLQAWSRFDRREARAKLFGNFYAGKHRAEVTR